MELEPDPALSHIPVIVVSACSRERTTELGAAAYLPKPFALDALLELVART